VHDGPRALQGGVRRGPRRRGRVDARSAGPRAPLQRDGVQEDPAALLHGRLPRLGARARRRVSGSSTVSLRDTRSAEAYARAVARPARVVTARVRAMRAIGRTPIFVDRASGAEIVDVDGNRYVDWVCSWGPLIHGHAHPDVVAAGCGAAARRATVGSAHTRAGERVTMFYAPTPGEVDLAAEIVARVPSVDMVRMTSSGTEATMTAIRLA